MNSGRQYERAVRPNDLGRFFVERANAGDVDGLVALYEPGAVVAILAGRMSTGSKEIRRAYQRLLADRPEFEPGLRQDALVNGDLALTWTHLVGGGATAEVARRQPDGTWHWMIDQPNVLG